MPIDEIRQVLSAPGVPARNELVAAHLSRLEEDLARTQDAVAALRDLLGSPQDQARAEISHRSVAAARSAAITAVIDIGDAGPWYQGALGELYATLGAQGLSPSGAPGGIYASGLFTHEHGQATVFIPCTGEIRPVGRAEPLEVPPAELAVIVHYGPHVTQHAIAVDGPVREYYLSGRHDTPDESDWRTEIGWPIFQTAPQ
jgi:hypothetical protein